MKWVMAGAAGDAGVLQQGAAAERLVQPSLQISKDAAAAAAAASRLALLLLLLRRQHRLTTAGLSRGAAALRGRTGRPGIGSALIGCRAVVCVRRGRGPPRAAPSEWSSASSPLPPPPDALLALCSSSSFLSAQSAAGARFQTRQRRAGASERRGASCRLGTWMQQAEPPPPIPSY